MKRVVKLLIVVFMIITFIGAGYVIGHEGKVSPGYAVCPMMMTLACQGIYRSFDKEEK